MTMIGLIKLLRNGLSRKKDRGSQNRILGTAEEDPYEGNNLLVLTIQSRCGVDFSSKSSCVATSGQKGKLKNLGVHPGSRILFNADKHRNQRKSE